MNRHFLAVIAAGLIAAGAAVADEVNDGIDAYQRGDHAAAIDHWRPLAEQGDIIAQFNLGLMYDKGLGVPRDPAEAAEWFRRAAEQGDAIAAYNLGLMYAEGRGVAQDYGKAADWYKFAMERAHPGAMLNLAILYANGLGVARDLGAAIHLTELSEETECLLGDTAMNHEPRQSSAQGPVGG